MPINVQGPDGKVYQFPDGTSQDVMARAMRQHYEKVRAEKDATADWQENAIDKGLGVISAAMGPAGAISEFTRRALRKRAEDGTAAADFAKDEGVLDRAGSLVERGYQEAARGLQSAAGTVTGLEAFKRGARRSKDVSNTDIAGTAKWEDAETVGDYLKFGAETGIQSLPEMAMTAIPYVGIGLEAMTQAGRISQDRAENNSRQDANIKDLLIAAPFGVTSAMLEKFGIDAVLGNLASKYGAKAVNNAVGRVVVGAAGEAMTEAIQSPVEYAGSTLGTDTPFSWEEAGQQALAGAVGGGVAGGVLSTTVETGRQAYRLSRRNVPSGEVETAVANEAVLTPDDEASALANEDILAGKAEMAAGVASGKADGILEANGLPGVKSRVSVTMPNGEARVGTIEDAFSVDAGEFGSAQGVKVRLDDGSLFEGHFDEMRDMGVTIAPEAPQTAAEIDAELAQEAETSAQAVEAALAAYEASAPQEGVTEQEGVSETVTPPPPTSTEDATDTLMAKIRRVESGGKDNAKNPRSSATGRYQFTDGTWLATYKAEFGDTGESPAAILVKRGDGDIQDRLMRRLTRGNAAGLEQAGIEANAGNLYLAHFAGIYGARKLHTAGKDTPVEQVLGQAVVDANPFLRGKTAGDVIAWAAQKMGGAAPTGTSPTSSDETDPYEQALRAYMESQERVEQATPAAEPPEPALTTPQDDVPPIVTPGTAPADLSPMPDAKTTGGEPQVAGGAPAAPSPSFSISDMPSGKSIVIRGLDNSEASKALVKAGLPEKGMVSWNAKQSGWIVSKKHEANVRAALEGGVKSEPVAAVVDEPFDAAKWQGERDKRIRDSRQAGNQHLDNLDRSVEGMRGKTFYNVHDPKERGTVRTVANTGDVVVEWADDYSAQKNLSDDGQTWLMPSDLQDYAVGSPAPSMKISDTLSDGTPIEEAAKAAKAVAGKSTYQLQDWSGVEITAYDGDNDSEEPYKGSTKERFLNDGRRYFKDVEKVLAESGFAGPIAKKGRKKGKPESGISINKAGPAVPGEVSFQAYLPDGRGVYVQFGQASNGDGAQLLVRGARRDSDPYGTRDTNQYWPADLTAGELSERLMKLAEGVLPEQSGDFESKSETPKSQRRDDVLTPTERERFEELRAENEEGRLDEDEIAEYIELGAKAKEDTRRKGTPDAKAADRDVEGDREAVPDRQQEAVGGDERGERKAASGDEDAAPATSSSTTEGIGQTIDDFGEKLEGARKDLWKAYADRLQSAKQEDVQSVPLSKSWPEPDYQKLIDEGADPYVVASMRAMRDAIPTKPRSYGVVAWGKQVEALRAYAEGLLNGDIDAEQQRKRLEGDFARSLRDLQGSIDLYMEFGHERSFKGITFGSNHYALYRGEKNVTKWAIEQKAKATAFSNWPRELAVGDTREEVIAKFAMLLANGGLDAKKKSDIVRFDIYSRRNDPGKFWIGKKIGKDYADLKSFPTAKEARDYKISDEGYAELVRMLESYKDIPSERKETNSPRIGINHRNGADVTPDQFMESFGFRGVQFGNYVEGPRRQADLNEAYDALMDLAGVLNVPAKALSLNGTLGLAFGARGKGGKGAASAHYERGEIVINLTKRSGAGSLAHEWWHSLDNYFSRSRNDPLSMLTDKPYERGEGVRPQMVQAFANVLTAIKSTSLKERSKNLDKRRTKEYWATDVEMSARAFENYVIAKLADEQHSNDYLANIVSEEAFAIDEGYPYLKAGEIAPVRAAFDEFFQTVEAKETETGVALYRQPQLEQQQTLNTEALQARLESYGIARKVALRIVDTLDGAAGSYENALIRIATDTAQDQNFTLNHEVIHALRDMGLFSNSDWAILAAKAKRDPGLMRSIKQRYPRLDAEAQTEEAVADMFARWQRGDYEAKGTIARLFQRLRQMLEAIGNAFAGRGLGSAEGVMGGVASGQVGSSVTSREDSRSGRVNRQSVLDPDIFPAEWLVEMSDADEMFRSKPTSSTTIDGALSDLLPGIRFERAVTPRSDLTGDALEGLFDKYNPDRASIFETPAGHRFVVFERGSEVWLDVHRLREGEGGSGIYQAVSDYAFNTGKVFIGDPDGLSDVALRRRNEAMLSSALKHGTTDHIAPHPRQTKGEAEIGVPPLRWVQGDTLGNIQAMIDVSLVSTLGGVPKLQDAHFDFSDGTFRDGDSRILSDDDLAAAAAAARGSGSPGAGRATVKRGILLHSLSRSTSGERPSLLERVLDERGQQILGSRLRGTFYSIPERPSPGFNRDDTRIGERSGYGRPPRDPSPEFNDEETEARYQDARKGSSDGETFVESVKGWLAQGWHGITRHWINLPNTPVYADLQQKLRAIEAAPQAAKERTVRLLEEMVRDFDKAELDLFTRKAILDDLSWEASQEHDLPFGFTPETIREELAKIDAILQADPDKKVWKAVMKRRVANRKIARELVDAGVLEAEAIKNPAYYRHQVLEYARAQQKFAHSAGNRLRAPKWARRMGSTLDINANLLEAEFDWLNKALMDIPIAHSIEWIKQSKHNILGDLKRQARESNKAGVNKAVDAAKKRLAEGTGSENDAFLVDAWTEASRKIAMGFQNLQDVLDSGKLDVPRHLEKAAAGLSSRSATSEPPFALLNWILDNDQPGAMGAAMVYKGIGYRNQIMRSVLGRNFIDPMDAKGLVKRLAPEGYATWQPDEGKLLFTVKTLPEHVIDGMIDKLAGDAPKGIDLDAWRAELERAKSMLAVGGDRYTMILPEEVVDTLNSLRMPERSALFDYLIEKPVRAWKRWILINPRRWFKYNLNNQAGDLDAVIAGNPRSLKKVGQAARELYAVMKNGERPSERYEDAVARGVFDSGISIQEIPDINQFAAFERFAEDNRKPHKLAMSGLRKAWRVLQGTTQFRENVFRYAAYLDYVERMEAGEPQPSIGYGASLPEMVDAVTDTKDRAALLARDLIGDYGAISHFGGSLRRTLIPFWSWMEINTKRYKRLAANAWSQGLGQGLATNSYLGVAVGARVTAGLMIRASLLYGMIQLWNNLFFPDEEDELGEMQATQLHVILGRNSDGEIITLRTQGALSDALSWFGFPDMATAFKEYQRGRGSLAEILMTPAKTTFNKLATAVTPSLSVPAETALGQKFWPDVFNPRPNRDPWRNVAATLSMENELDLARDALGDPVPDRGYGRSWQNAFIYRRDPGEIAYNEARGIAYDWKRRVRGQEGRSSMSTPRSDAMRDYRQSLKFGDMEAAEAALYEMAELGVSQGDYDAMIKRAHPLSPIAKKDRDDFISGLTDAEYETFVRAEEWYFKTFGLPGE